MTPSKYSVKYYEYFTRILTFLWLIRVRTLKTRRGPSNGILLYLSTSSHGFMWKCIEFSRNSSTYYSISAIIFEVILDFVKESNGLFSLFCGSRYEIFSKFPLPSVTLVMLCNRNTTLHVLVLLGWKKKETVREHKFLGACYIHHKYLYTLYGQDFLRFLPPSFALFYIMLYVLYERFFGGTL